MPGWQGCARQWGGSWVSPMGRAHASGGASRRDCAVTYWVCWWDPGAGRAASRATVGTGRAACTCANHGWAAPAAPSRTCSARGLHWRGAATQSGAARRTKSVAVAAAVTLPESQRSRALLSTSFSRSGLTWGAGAMAGQCSAEAGAMEGARGPLRGGQAWVQGASGGCAGVRRRLQGGGRACSDLQGGGQACSGPRAGCPTRAKHALA